MVDGWIKWPILDGVNKIVNGFRSNNVIKVIINTLLKGGGLNKEDFSKKQFMFKKNGLNVFGGRGQEWHSKLKIHGMGVHCVAHRTNLVIQFWGDLIFIARIESFMFNMYDYFNHLFKQNLKF